MTHYNAHTNRRALRVGEAMRHVLADLLAVDTSLDASLGGIPITVSEVRVSSDLRHADAYVLPLGGKISDIVMTTLEHTAPKLRGPVARALNLKYAPIIEFKIDRSFDNAKRIDAVLQEYNLTDSSPLTAKTSDNDHSNT